MKSLKTYETKEALALVLGHRELRDKFQNYVWECEHDYMSDKLSCFERGAIDYEFGTCYPSWIHVRNDWDALLGVEKSVNYFGATTKVERLARQTRRLYGSNLFSYMVEKLVQTWFEAEILEVIKYVEDVGYALYCEDAEEVEKLAWSHFECFIENGYLDDYDVEEDGTMYRTYAVA